jgi:hypothetical protein
LARGIDRTRADQTNQTAAQLAQQRAESSSSSAVAAIAALFKYVEGNLTFPQPTL